MPTIKEKLHFNYDGIWSSNFGIISVNVDSGMFEETFVADRELLETKVRGGKPLFHGLDSSPLEFDMIIAFEKEFTDSDVDAVLRWLFTDYYKPLYFLGKENKIYYCMPVDSSKIVHNGLRQGYISLKMRCSSSNVYSQNILTNSYNVAGSIIVELENDGHYDIYPEISIKKVNQKGEVIIENLSLNSYKIFEIRDLEISEGVYINCEKEIIETDMIGLYRYDNLVGHFTKLIHGKNDIKITGDCIVQFRYKNKYKF